MREIKKQYITQIFLEKGERLELLMNDNPNFGILFSCKENSIDVEGVPFIKLAENILEWKQMHAQNKDDKVALEAYMEHYLKLREISEKCNSKDDII